MAAAQCTGTLSVAKVKLRHHCLPVFRLLLALAACLACGPLAFSSSSRPSTSSAYRKDVSLKLSKPVPTDQPEFRANMSSSECMLISLLSDARQATSVV